MTREHIGSSFDDFLRDDGLYEGASATAAIRVLAWQLKQALETEGITKAELARRMGTSRSQVDRLLKADGSEVKLSTLERAAKAVNRSLVFELR
jgi:antitoxin HicB